MTRKFSEFQTRTDGLPTDQLVGLRPTDPADATKNSIWTLDTILKSGSAVVLEAGVHEFEWADDGGSLNAVPGSRLKIPLGGITLSGDDTLYLYLTNTRPPFQDIQEIRVTLWQGATTYSMINNFQNAIGGLLSTLASSDHTDSGEVSATGTALANTFFSTSDVLTGSSWNSVTDVGWVPDGDDVFPSADTIIRFNYVCFLVRATA